MIKYDPKNWFLVFSFKRGLIKKMYGSIVLITLLTTSLCLIHRRFPHWNIDISATLPGYMGAALGLLLVFRTNTAYDKWWEARKELGALVNVTRNLAINVNGILHSLNKDKLIIARLVIAFVWTMKEHLRGKRDISNIDFLEKEDHALIEQAQHRPNVVANIIVGRIELLYEQKLINEYQQILLMQQVNTLIDIIGKCERIKNTPIPFAYAMLLKFFITVYVVILPLGLIDEAGWYSIPLVLALFYIMMSIVLTAEEIEEPFGRDLNDLPIDEMSNNIKNNIMEIVEHH